MEGLYAEIVVMAAGIALALLALLLLIAEIARGLRGQLLQGRLLEPAPFLFQNQSASQ
jgi:hypothetical protein